MANEVPGGPAPRPEADDGRRGTAGRPAVWRWVLGLFGTALGAVSLVAGLTWTLLYVEGPQPVVDVTVGVVLALGGLVLLMPHRLPLPPLATTAAAAGTALAGTAAGLAAGTTRVCCMYGYVAERGFPLRWQARGAIADDPDTARRLAEDSGWHVDLAALAANLFVWSYVGMLVVALVVLVRRAR
ncbi:hypothetical protein [Jidongwangia harbinensis]|uniref:hypothetical protein n=1 Tax=Jidongwangia harbinensis TaxID=2878561 RepID=UPI001CD99014|nr:hypothetical protein [Jidongwangia harbinensis]MCA2218648.1 hypothetical protein [Jidongwangia harbinensis]